MAGFHQRWLCIAVLSATGIPGAAQIDPQPVPPPAPQPRPVLAAGDPLPKKPVARLGVTVRELLPEESQRHGLPSEMGLVVVNAVEGSPAKKAGLKKDDILRLFNDQVLIVPRQLGVLVRSSEIGAEASLTVRRNGEEITYKATLDASPPVQPLVPAEPEGFTITQRVVKIFVGSDPSPKTTIAMSTQNDRAHLVITEGEGGYNFDGPVDEASEIPKEMWDRIKTVAELKEGQWRFKLALHPPVELKPEEGPKPPAPEP